VLDNLNPELPAVGRGKAGMDFLYTLLALVMSVFVPVLVFQATLSHCSPDRESGYW
jgi:hypothetical protein